MFVVDTAVAVAVVVVTEHYNHYHTYPSLTPLPSPDLTAELTVDYTTLDPDLALYFDPDLDLDLNKNPGWTLDLDSVQDSELGPELGPVLYKSGIP